MGWREGELETYYSYRPYEKSGEHLAKCMTTETRAESQGPES